MLVGLFLNNKSSLFSLSLTINNSDRASNYNTKTTEKRLRILTVKPHLLLVITIIIVKWISNIRVQSHTFFQPHRPFNIPRGNPENQRNLENLGHA